MKNNWTSYGASVIGPSHVKFKIPNQDFWISKHYSWGHIVVVSDGLGSHEKSDIGSRAACNAVVKASKIYLKHQSSSLENLLRLVHSIWLMELDAYKPQICSATCLFVLITKDKCIAAQLGDGAIIALANNETDSFIMDDEKEDSFSNITKSLYSNFNFKHWKIKEIDITKYKAFILLTDGISDDIIKENQLNFANELITSYKEYSHSKAINEIKNWMINWPVPHHSDDKTIACLYKKDIYAGNK